MCRTFIPILKELLTPYLVQTFFGSKSLFICIDSIGHLVSPASLFCYFPRSFKELSKGKILGGQHYEKPLKVLASLGLSTSS